MLAIGRCPASAVPNHQGIITHDSIETSTDNLSLHRGHRDDQCGTCCLTLSVSGQSQQAWPAAQGPGKVLPQAQAPSKIAPAPQAPAKIAPAPQAPAKIAPAPQAPSKIAPAPQAPSKIAPAPQAPSKIAPAPQAPAKYMPAAAPQAPAKYMPAAAAPQAPAKYVPAAAPQAPAKYAPVAAAPQAPAKLVPTSAAPKRRSRRRASIDRSGDPSAGFTPRRVTRLIRTTRIDRRRRLLAIREAAAVVAIGGASGSAIMGRPSATRCGWPRRAPPALVSFLQHTPSRPRFAVGDVRVSAAAPADGPPRRIHPHPPWAASVRRLDPPDAPPNILDLQRSEAMMRSRHTSARPAVKNAPDRDLRPNLEGLEGRILLYSTLGQWTYSSRITYSFMPDGTNVGGVPSALFQTMNAVVPHRHMAGPDRAGRHALGGQRQRQPRPGPRRRRSPSAPTATSRTTRGSATSASAPSRCPPASSPRPSSRRRPTAAPLAGDILFNSTIHWQIGSGYDLATVAAHEFGHALGLGESTVPTAVMYGTYNGIKTALTSDDIAGIQSLYGAPQYDQFNNGGHHNSSFLTRHQHQLVHRRQRPDRASRAWTSRWPTQSEYYVVTVPATNSGQMVVTVQSSNLSSLAPAMYIYNSSLGQVATASLPNTYGATIWTSNAVTAGQKYYIKVRREGPTGGWVRTGLR